MKTYFYILFLIITFIPLEALPCTSCKTGNGIYEDTQPVKIHFEMNGEILTYETKMGSAFAAADTVIIGEDLYIKYPRSKPAQYIALGKIKKNEDGSYTWINEGDEKLRFLLTSDIQTPTQIESIRFDASLDELKPYVKTWDELFQLEDHGASIKQEVANIIEKKEQIQEIQTMPSQSTQINSACGEKKEKIQILTDETKKETRCERDRSCTPNREPKTKKTEIQKKESKLY